MKILISVSAEQKYSIWEVYELKTGTYTRKLSHWLGKASPRKMSKEKATELAAERNKKPPQGYLNYRAKVMKAPK